jgi:hypothetical protein
VIHVTSQYRHFVHVCIRGDFRLKGNLYTSIWNTTGLGTAAARAVAVAYN